VHTLRPPPTAAGGTGPSGLANACDAVGYSVTCASRHAAFNPETCAQSGERPKANSPVEPKFIRPSVNRFTLGSSLSAPATRVVQEPAIGVWMHKSTDDLSVTWRSRMKTLITALVITFIAAPGITQSALAASPNEVIVGGKNIGSDPDSNVRFQMRRDVGSEGF
jgi:hypothetical protein